jgi:hypothetical protein
MMTMKEACEYVKTSHKKRSAIHSATVTNGDYCSGLNDREYNKVKIKVKGAGGRSRKYSHTKLWSDQNLSNHIHTMYYDKVFTK